MQHLIVDVGEILGEHGASLEVHQQHDLDTLYAGEDAYVPQQPAQVAVTVSHAGEGIVANGTVDVDFRVECVRCLAPFPIHIQGEVEGLYVHDVHEQWAQEEDAEPITDGQIDLAHAIDSAIRVVLPFAPVHAEDCKGICPHCGCDLNAETCDCSTAPEAAGPFAVLKDLVVGEEGDTEESPE